VFILETFIIIVIIYLKKNYLFDSFFENNSLEKIFCAVDFIIIEGGKEFILLGNLIDKLSRREMKKKSYIQSVYLDCSRKF